MAKILISYYADVGEAMYDAICSELLKYGNDVFRLNIKCKDVLTTKWGGESSVKGKFLKEKVQSFSPDIVLNFNNSFPVDLYSSLERRVKNCLLDADNPDYFWNKGYLIENNKKYLYLGCQSCSKIMYERFLGRKLKDIDEYIYFPLATVVTNEELEKDKNISFIGTNYFPRAIPFSKEFYSPQVVTLYEKFQKDYYFSLEDANKLFKDFKFSKDLYQMVRNYYVGQDRLKYMQSIEDLGFTFYGVPQWKEISFYDFELAKCFDKTEIASISDNQTVYNTSKISIDISHPQAKTSFSWRVMDIMASSSCLLMKDKLDWRRLFSSYLSKETLDAILYHDRFDMRLKAQKLLIDENLRKRCVKELNYAISKNGRWIHRFKLLEEFTEKSIIHCSEKKEVEYIYVKGELKKDEPVLIKERFKLLYYTWLLTLYSLPFADRLFSCRRLNRIKNSIIKHIQKGVFL